MIQSYFVYIIKATPWSINKGCWMRSQAFPGAITNRYTRAAATAIPRGINQPVQPLK